MNGSVTTLPGDFEPQSAMLIGVNELLPHHPQVLTELVAALIDRLPVIAVVTGEPQRRDLLTTLCDWGLPAHRVHSISSAAVGLWVRDYGPTLVKRDGRVCILDAEYWYPGRQADDKFPGDFGRLLGIDVYAVPLLVEGGNLLSNGRGMALCSTSFLQRNSQRYESRQALGALSAHYGLKSIPCVAPLDASTTKHIDLFATFTSADTLVLGKYDLADDPVNAARLDHIARLVQGLDSGAGPLKVERIPMPHHRDGIWRTYTNVVMTDEVVVMPSYAGIPRRLEREAIATYRRLLPGREIVTVEATSLAKTGGVLRCVTMNIPYLGHALDLEHPARHGRSAAEPQVVSASA